MQTRKLTRMAMLTGIAVTIFIVEAQLPPLVAIPGVKLGLSNIVTLVALVFMSRREAGIILGLRILLSNIFAGTISAMLFSAVGGLLAFLVMAGLIGIIPKNQLWVVSILAALAHNLGQLVVAAWVMGTVAVLVNLPALIIAGVVTGAFTGLCVIQLEKHGFSVDN